MGRTRPVSRSADEDPNNRSKKRKTVSGMETLYTGQEMNERKASLYHCNYCNKDISGKTRIKCLLCPDFDLCVECFSVGAKVTPHESNHPYRVMDNLSFPLICPDWNADEEMLLLEGIEMYGFGNWTEVADYVGTKSKLQCIDHYDATYLNSTCFPLPDMSHVMGKSKEELVAMAKGPGELKEFPILGELSVKEESSVSARPKCEEFRNEESAHRSSSSLTAESHVDRSVGEKKPRSLGDERPSMTELSGYNFKRQEFETEYDNDAEQLLADMEFKDTDSDAEHELKLRVLRIYSNRLDERKRRKDFILERNLLYPDPFEKNLSPEERKICKPFKVYMRFHSKEEHEELLKSLIEEYHIEKRIQDLQEARVAGCRTAAEANRFIEKKKALQSANRVKVSSQAGPSGTISQHGDEPQGPTPQTCGKDSSLVAQAFSSSLEDWDVSGFVGADLLSETERRLCSEIRILPAHYLSMLQTMSEEIFEGSMKKKSDAYSLFKVEPSKIDRVYDMLVEKGIA